MRTLERVELFNFRSGSIFFVSLILIALLSLSWEYHQYKELTRFDNPLITAQVVSQEVRLIGGKPKTSILFKLENHSTVRCAMSPYLKDLRGRNVLLELWVNDLKFIDYLKGFRCRGTIQEVYPSLSLKERWYQKIAFLHDDLWMKELYGALFVATPMSQEFQTLVGAMGLSHILSISGYHFGILSLIVFFFLRPVYRFFHGRYFPYRHANRDMFVIVLSTLFFYLWALEFIPPMVRSFGMIAVGYFLYDRGIKVISFQTLLIAVGVLLAFFPKLFFSLGFWFSSFGVLSIFIFVRYYEHWKPWQIFLALHIWCYLILLPISLAIFGKFGFWHIGSIPLALLFNLYYPSVLALHLTPWAGIYDGLLIQMFEHGDVHDIVIPMWMAITSIFAAVAAMRWKIGFWISGIFGMVTLGSAVYQIA